MDPVDWAPDGSGLAESIAGLWLLGQGWRGILGSLTAAGLSGAGQFAAATGLASRRRAPRGHAQAGWHKKVPLRPPGWYHGFVEA